MILFFFLLINWWIIYCHMQCLPTGWWETGLKNPRFNFHPGLSCNWSTIFRWPEYRSPIGPYFRNSVYKSGAKSHLSSEVNMTPTWMFSASLLLAAAQANSLYPASTFPLRMLHRSPRFGNERTLYTGFQPPLQSESYEVYNNVASTRTLGKITFWICQLVMEKQYFSRKYNKSTHW